MDTPPAEMSSESFTTEDTEMVQQVVSNWNGGNQPAALQTVLDLAKQGKRWAIALHPWLSMQLGMPHVKEAMAIAISAKESGMPWVTHQFFNHVASNLPSYPELRESVVELARNSVPWTGLDLAGTAWNMISQGYVTEGMSILHLTWEDFTMPQNLLQNAKDYVANISSLESTARESFAKSGTTLETLEKEVRKSRDEFQTSVQQAGLLVTAATSDATNTLFKEDAERNRLESRKAWIVGLVVLGAAALIAVLPLFLHYMGKGPDYSAIPLLGTHVASTAALATFAGVLLARARNRDQAAQRARDLSTAMGTMIAYSNQIQGAEERERFMMTMGQLVLQAHLTSGTVVTPDESVSGAFALAQFMRQQNPTNAS